MEWQILLQLWTYFTRHSRFNVINIETAQNKSKPILQIGTFLKDTYFSSTILLHNKISYLESYLVLETRNEIPY